MNQTKTYTVLRPAAGVLICAGILFFLICAAGRLTTPQSIYSYCFADYQMPENSTSVLTGSVMTAEEGTVSGHAIHAGTSGARVRIALPSKEGEAVRCAELLFDQPFAAMTECSLSWPDESGSFSEQAVLIRKIPAGRSRIYYSLPESVRYPVKELLLTVGGDCTVQDLLISGEELIREYRPAEHVSIRTCLFLFLLMLALTALAAFFRRGILRALKVFAAHPDRLLIPAAAGAAGMGLAYIVCRLSGRQFSEYRGLMTGAVFFVTAAELRLLLAGGTRVVRTGQTASAKTLLPAAAVIACFVLVLLLETADRFTAAPPEVRNLRFFGPLLFLLWQTVLCGMLYVKYFVLSEGTGASFRAACVFLPLLLASAYMILFLPFIAPDESMHYLSVYRLSGLLLGKVTPFGDGRLLMRAEDYAFYTGRSLAQNAASYAEMAEKMHFFAQSSEVVMTEASMATNALAGYLPAAFGVALARILHLGALPAFWAARFANILFCSCTYAYLARRHPQRKTLLFAIMCMPMLLHLTASCSYDAVIFCFAALFVSECSRLSLTDSPVSLRDCTALCIYGMLLAPSKIVYAPLIFMIFMIPGEKLSHSRRKAAWIRILLAGACLLALFASTKILGWLSTPSALTQVARSGSGRILSWCNEESYSLSFLLAHPFSAVLLFFRTLREQAGDYLMTMTGSLLGQMNIPVSPLCSVLSLLMVYLAGHVCETDSVSRITGGMRAGLLLITACSAAAILLAMALSWTPVTSDVINGVQGRYFLPLILPFCLALQNSRVRADAAVKKSILLVSGMVNLWVLASSWAGTMLTVNPG